ncbi:MAG: protein kinase [candidate division WOR-3 bacterium]
MAELACLIEDPKRCHCCTISESRQCRKYPGHNQQFCHLHLKCQKIARPPLSTKQTQTRKQAPVAPARATLAVPVAPATPATPAKPAKPATLTVATSARPVGPAGPVGQASSELSRFPLRKIDFPLRIYKFSDFAIEPVASSSLLQGTYGEILFARIKETNQEVVLKKYREPINEKNVYYLIANIREIVILHHLNQYPETKVVKLYGVCLEGEYLYAVLERLKYNLDDVTVRIRARVDKNYGVLSLEQYKIIFYQLLQIFNNIHSLGFVHNDIKLTNLMIDHGEIRVIDFGLSDFLGIGPLIEISETYVGTDVIKAPDEKGMRQYLPNNRKSYASDSYSIAASIIHMVLRGYEQLYVDVDHRVIAWSRSDRPLSSNLCPYIEKKLTKSGVDLLLKMLHPDTHQRWCCRQALQHPFFANIKDLNIKSLEQIGSGLPKAIFKRLRDQYIQYTDNHYLRKNMELCYYDLIHLNYQNNLIPDADLEITNSGDITRYEQYINLVLSIWLIERYNTFVNFDSLINSMIMVKRSFGAIRPTKDYNKILYGGFLNGIYDSVMKGTVPLNEYSALIDRNYTSRDWLQLFVNEYLLNIGRNLILIPFWSHLIYLYLEIFYHWKLEPFKNLMSEFTIEVGKWVFFFFFQTFGFPLPLTSWDLIQYTCLRVLGLQMQIPTVETLKLVKTEDPLFNIVPNKIIALDDYYQRGINRIKVRRLDFLHYTLGYNPFKEIYQI